MLTLAQPLPFQAQTLFSSSAFPFPLGMTQPPTSHGEEEHQEGTSWPPTQPQTELHLHVLRLAGGARGPPPLLRFGSCPFCCLRILLPHSAPFPSIYEQALFYRTFPRYSHCLAFPNSFGLNVCQGVCRKHHANALRGASL